MTKTMVMMTTTLNTMTMVVMMTVAVVGMMMVMVVVVVQMKLLSYDVGTAGGEVVKKCQSVICWLLEFLIEIVSTSITLLLPVFTMENV